MCTEDEPTPMARGPHRQLFQEEDEPPDWRTMLLPAPAVLKLLFDAHCHPTDLPFSQQQVQDVGLGGLSAMATRVHDQALVESFGETYGKERQIDGSDASTDVVVCFGYHPWFSHLFSVNSPEESVNKQQHYESIFIPSSLAPSKKDEYRQILSEIIDLLPEPVRLGPLLGNMRQRIRKALARGRKVMVGEVGLDRSFRIPYPPNPARNDMASNTNTVEVAENRIATGGLEQELAEKENDPTAAKPKTRTKTLTPFTTSTAHQLQVLELQFQVALECGVNVSLHSVKAQGETIKFLRDFKKAHGAPFEDSVNVDLHSCGGWSVESWASESKFFKNLYTSPSLAISSRTSVTPHLIRKSDPTRLLVESDTHLIDDTTRRTWAAAVWIAQCRGWRVEWTEEDLDRAGEEGVVMRLHRNWKAFIRI
ncbi:hypothetical protein QFC21_003353 [Naganishia friedmannii]|uniref:Uncharacterized protein n=1 Tax=Naganishia friedmannii TaxID=89922 RepID=A0ACC2VPZ4_9TREE|nr:hypothetical protein QFC21_003353 [Naganishia friedmannii]